MWGTVFCSLSLIVMRVILSVVVVIVYWGVEWLCKFCVFGESVGKVVRAKMLYFVGCLMFV